MSHTPTQEEREDLFREEEEPPAPVAYCTICGEPLWREDVFGPFYTWKEGAVFCYDCARRVTRGVP